MIRRLNRYFDRHPLLAIALGFALVVVIVLVAVPADPENLGQQHTEKTT